MKTYIINLDLHDDIISARDKMGWAKAERILLVWPERVRLLDRRLDLVLLQRHSAALGAQLGVISRDREVCYHAPRLGILVFKDLRQAQRSNWRLPRRFRKSAYIPTDQPASPSATEQKQAERGDPNESNSAGAEILAARHTLPLRPPKSTALHPAIRLAFFFLGVLAVLALTAILIPSAKINLTPARREQETNIEIQASQETAEVSLTGAVPARPVNIIIEGREVLPVSGSIVLPEKAATGQVVFTNLTDSQVTIPENTVVRSKEKPAIGFTVTQEGRIPAGPGQTLSLPVRCMILGSQGNLPAETLIAIDGLLGTQVTVINPQPTRNGSDRKEPAPTDSDRSQLHERLLSSLQESALVELQRSLEENDLVLTPSLHLVQIIEESFLPAERQPADQLSLNLRAEYQALVVSGEDLFGLAESVLNANQPAGFAALHDTLQITNLTEPHFEGSLAAWKLAAQRQLVAEISVSRAARLVLGLSPQQASKRLEENLPLGLPAQIDLFPAWWPRLTILPFRIQVNIRQ